MDKYKLETWADAFGVHPMSIGFLLGFRWTPRRNVVEHTVAEIAQAFEVDEQSLSQIMQNGARLLSLHDIAERYGLQYDRMLLWRRFDPDVLPVPFFHKTKKLIRFHPADVRAALPRMRDRDRQADQHRLSKSNRVLVAA